MIYTVTFNPALDYVVFLDGFREGELNRSKREALYFGGKGINVSMILQQLGVETTALGFVAGLTGQALEAGVEAEGIKTDFIRLSAGNTRINVKLKHGQETEINGQGPEVTEDALEALYCRLDALKEDDILVLAGSIPGTMPSDTYERILERLSGRGIRFAVDATKELLLNVVKYRPFLVKPNQQELGELFGADCSTEEAIECYGRKLQELGAQNVLVSRAGDGAVLLTAEKKLLRIDAPLGKVVNSVGAGDSMVAGFLAGFLETGDYEEALRLGTAAGSATAFSEGLAKKQEIMKIKAAMR